MKKIGFNNYIPSELTDGESCRLLTTEQYKEYQLLKKKLDIATKALKEYENSDDYNYVGTTERGVYWTNNKWIYPWRLARKALKEIKEVK